MATPLPNHGSESVFLKLFIQHEAALRAYVRVLIPTWDGVDEVIQESSVVMFKKFDQLDDPKNFMIWAKVIVRFAALRYRRDRARDRHVFQDDFYDLLAKEEDEQDINHDQEIRALRRCLAEVKPDYQELLLAPYTGPGRLKKIAESSGRSPNSIYKLLQRLRRKLSQCVAGRLAQTAYNT